MSILNILCCVVLAIECVNFLNSKYSFFDRTSGYILTASLYNFLLKSWVTLNVFRVKNIKYYWVSMKKKSSKAILNYYALINVITTPFSLLHIPYLANSIEIFFLSPSGDEYLFTRLGVVVVTLMDLVRSTLDFFLLKIHEI